MDRALALPRPTGFALLEPASRPQLDAARILTHITCAACGAQEYLPFIPEDPAKALCRACFAKERPEHKSAPRHPHL